MSLHTCAINMHIHRHKYTHIRIYTDTHIHIHKRGNKGSGEMAPQLRTGVLAEDPGLGGTHVVAHNVYNSSSQRFDFSKRSGGMPLITALMRKVDLSAPSQLELYY